MSEKRKFSKLIADNQNIIHKITYVYAHSIEDREDLYAINPGIHAPPSIFTTAHAHPPLTNARDHIQVGGTDRP